MGKQSERHSSRLSRDASAVEASPSVAAVEGLTSADFAAHKQHRVLAVSVAKHRIIAGALSAVELADVPELCVVINNPCYEPSKRRGGATDAA